MNQPVKLFSASLLWCIFSSFSIPLLGQNLDNVRSTFPHDDVAFLNISHHYTIVNNDGETEGE